MAPSVTKVTEGLDLVPVIFNLQGSQITLIANSFILLGFFSLARLITLLLYQAHRLVTIPFSFPYIV